MKVISLSKYRIRKSLEEQKICKMTFLKYFNPLFYIFLFISLCVMIISKTVEDVEGFLWEIEKKIQ